MEIPTRPSTMQQECTYVPLTEPDCTLTVSLVVSHNFGDCSQADSHSLTETEDRCKASTWMPCRSVSPSHCDAVDDLTARLPDGCTYNRK